MAPEILNADHNQAGYSYEAESYACMDLIDWLIDYHIHDYD